jgi:Ca-activated chloride channel homolog
MGTQRFSFPLLLGLSLLGLGGCNANARQGFEVKFLVGSALKPFCNQFSEQFNATNPKLENGEAFYVTCETQGSGDVVNQVLSLATQLKSGTLKAEDPKFPTLISVDGEIYQAQLVEKLNQLQPGQNYIPPISDTPLIAYSPMVYMAASDVAPAVRKQVDLFQALVKAKTHRDLDQSAPLTPIHFVHSAPTRSNSGLLTLITQFASISSKRPEQLTVQDIQQFQPQIQAIQKKVTRYGTSTDSLAKDMVKNGPFWASIGAVYESSVIQANQGSTGKPSYEAIYPKATFTSNMRAILPNAPWVSAQEKAAAQKVLEALQAPSTQKLAAELGLRPGVPGTELGAKFTPQFGVETNPQYDSLRSPQPEVVAAMLKSWQEFAKKPSQVVLVVDSSGSMSGNKLPSVQATLRQYIEALGPKEQVTLIDFDSEIRNPVQVDGTPQGRDRALQFISSLSANGGTSLYDATLAGRNWLFTNFKPEAINAVVVLTDGEDSGSKLNQDQLRQELEKSGFKTDKRIAVFTVGYGSDGEFNSTVLKEMAEQNGGYYRQGNPDSISNLMADLQTEF